MRIVDGGAFITGSLSFARAVGGSLMSVLALRSRTSSAVSTTHLTRRGSGEFPASASVIYFPHVHRDP